MNPTMIRWGTVMLAFLAWALRPAAVHARPGSVDPFFDTSSGVNHPVMILGVRSDGRILVRGWFDGPQGRARPGVARLHPDGRLDRVFSASHSSDGPIESVDFLPDGRMLVAGGFSSIQGRTRRGLARLLEDGDLDPDFVPPEIAVRWVRVQADGNILAEVDEARRIVRLRPDGSRDATFAVAPEVTSPSLVGVLGDGRILVTRTTLAGGEWVGELIRLAPDGRLDPTFEPTPIGLAGYEVRWLYTQADGKMFFQVGNHLIRVVRVNPDGGIDSGFGTATAADWGSIDDSWLHAVAVAPDGSPFIGGVIEIKDPRYMSGDEEFDQGYVRRLRREDGWLDSSFDVTLDGGPPGRPSSVSRVVAQSDGRLLVAGIFSAVNGVGRRFLARLEPDGRTDVSFNANQGADASVYAIAPLADGKVLLAGRAVESGVIGQRSVVRLRADGSADTAFEAILRDPETHGPTVRSLALLDDGRILAAADDRGVLRLLPEGRRDETFDSRVWTDEECRVRLQPDGRILIFGGVYIDPATGVERRTGIVRLQRDGSWDRTFDPGSGVNGQVRDVALDSQGRILVAGNFTEVAGSSRMGLARLMPDGRLDPSFDVPLRSHESIRCLAVQPDGKIVVGGTFDTLVGMRRGGVARLQPDGDLDEAFVSDIARTGGSSPPTVHALAIQADGRIVVGGSFDTADRRPRRNVARLNPDGSVDPVFDPGQGPDGDVFAVALRGDGRVLIAGEFRIVDGVPRHRVAQLLGHPGNEVTLGSPRLVSGRPGFEVTAVTGRRVSIESSLDLNHWTPLRTVDAGPRPVRFVDEEPPSVGRRFYRAVWHSEESEPER